MKINYFLAFWRTDLGLLPDGFGVIAGRIWVNLTNLGGGSARQIWGKLMALGIQR